MRILTVGQRRSGSTALFNLIRVVCEQNGRTYGCFEDTYDEDIADQCDFVIIKAHKYKEELVHWADVVFTIFREPEDVKASIERFAKKGGKEYTDKDFIRGLAWWGLYQFHASYCVYFNQIVRSPGTVARRTAEIMDLVIDEKKVIATFNRIQPPKTGYDPITLLHANHVTK